MPATLKQATASQSTLPAADVGTPLSYQCSDIGSDISPTTSNTFSLPVQLLQHPGPVGGPVRNLANQTIWIFQSMEHQKNRSTGLKLRTLKHGGITF